MSSNSSTSRREHRRHTVQSPPADRVIDPPPTLFPVQDPQHRSQRVGLTRREGRFEHRLTAILDLGDELHLVILTAIDTTVKISTAVDAKEARDDLRGPELPAGLLPTGLLLGRSMPGSLPAERRPSSSGRRRSWRP